MLFKSGDDRQYSRLSANEAEEIKQRENLFATITAGRQMAAYLARCRFFMPTSVFSMFKMPKNCIKMCMGLPAISLYGDKSGSPLCRHPSSIRDDDRNNI